MFLACRRLKYGWVPRFTLLNSAPNVSYKNSKTPALYIFNQLQYYKKLLLQFRSPFLPCFKLISSCVFISSSCKKKRIDQEHGERKQIGQSRGSREGKGEPSSSGFHRWPISLEQKLLKDSLPFQIWGFPSHLSSQWQTGILQLVVVLYRHFFFLFFFWGPNYQTV